MTSDAVTRGLSAFSFVRIVEAPSDRGGPGPNKWSDAQAMSLAREIGAGTVVGGTIYPVGGGMQLQFRVLDPTSRTVIRMLPPIRLQNRSVGADLMAAIEPLLSTVAIVASPALGAVALPPGDPPRLAAVSELVAGLSLSGQNDSASRFTVLRRSRRAFELDSGYLQAALWTIAARQAAFPSFYYSEFRHGTDSLVREAAAFRDRFSPFETALFNLVESDQSGELTARMAAIRRFQEIAPDGIVSSLLPATLLDLNRPREALKLLERQKAGRTQSGDLIRASEDAGRWRLMADIKHYLGDHEGELAAVKQLHRVLPDHITTARYELKAMVALNDSAGIEERLDALPALKPVPQSNQFVGDVILSTGQEMIAHGNRAFGRTIIERTLAWFATQQLDSMPPNVRLRLALAYHALGRETEALAAVKPLLDNEPNSSFYVGTAGRIAAAMGDTAEAMRRDAQLANMRSEGLFGYPTIERAFIAAQLGRRETAVALLKRGLAEGSGFSIRGRLHWFPDVDKLRGYPPFEKLLVPEG